MKLNRRELMKLGIASVVKASVALPVAVVSPIVRKALQIPVAVGAKVAMSQTLVSDALYHGAQEALAAWFQEQFENDVIEAFKGLG